MHAEFQISRSLIFSILGLWLGAAGGVLGEIQWEHCPNWE